MSEEQVKKFHYFFKIVFIIIFCIFLIFGIVRYTEKNHEIKLDADSVIHIDTIKEEGKKNPEEKKQISDGIYFQEFPIFNKNDSQTDNLAVVTINPNIYKFSILQDTQNPKTVMQWAQENNAKIVINGGYFNEDYSSSGGLIIDNEIFGTITKTGKNGYSGMLLIKDGKPELRYLPHNSYSEEEDINYAIQTFPTLILPGGAKGILTDSKKTAARTIIARDINENILFIVTEGFSFSLYEIMNKLLELNIDIDMAVNLDGGPSSGISIQFENFKYNIESAAVPNAVVVK